jgi:predicted aconitase
LYLGLYLSEGLLLIVVSAIARSSINTLDRRKINSTIDAVLMDIQLSLYDRSLLAGERGPAPQLAMRIVTRMAQVYEARELLDISGAHIDSTIYIGEANLEFAERLAGLGAHVVVPTTLNVSGLDEHGWQGWAVPADWAEKARRQMQAYQQMGCIPTWTCAPYQTDWKPSFGQQIAWGESNAIVFANSVLGARTERYPDLLDICCAITGRVPAVGLHLTENRLGQLLFRLRDIPLEIQQEDIFYPVLGYLIGKIAQDGIPVIDGLSVQPSEDQLKALGAAAASSGAVALFHIVGVTPEAPDLNTAFRGRQPQSTIDVQLSMLRDARRELTSTDSDRVDMVVLGSPHFSLAEFRQLAPLLAGRHTYPGVQFLVTSSRAVAMFARQAGYLQALEGFGGKVTVDTCILASPMLPASVRILMTNSAKYAYYAPGMLNTQVAFGSLEDCVRSAVAGRVVREPSRWDTY